jgi:hypothetical protein
LYPNVPLGRFVDEHQFVDVHRHDVLVAEVVD